MRMSRNVRRLVGVGAVMLAMWSMTASAALTIPGCMYINQTYGFNYRNYNPNPLKYDCGFDAQHGNFGGPYANIYFWNTGINTSVPCTSVSSRVTWAQSGTLINSARKWNSNVGTWSTAGGPNGYGIFGSRWWNTRPGVYDDRKDSFVAGFNC